MKTLEILIFLLLLIPLAAKGNGIDTTSKNGWKPTGWSANLFSYKSLFIDSTKMEGNTCQAFDITGTENSWIEIEKTYSPPVPRNNRISCVFFRKLSSMAPNPSVTVADMYLYTSDGGNYSQVSYHQMSVGSLYHWQMIVGALPAGSLNYISKAKIKFRLYFFTTLPDTINIKVYVDWWYIENSPIIVVDSFEGIVNGISNQNTGIPKKYSLSQNYPNPFNPKTTIKFDISRPSYAKLIIYDVLGKEVSTLVDEKLNAGGYEIDFNASNLTSGTYFYRLIAGEFIETKKMLLLK